VIFIPPALQDSCPPRTAHHIFIAYLSCIQASFAPGRF
jgi:hypothetical protein